MRVLNSEKAIALLEKAKKLLPGNDGILPQKYLSKDGMDAIIQGLREHTVDLDILANTIGLAGKKKDSDTLLTGFDHAHGDIYKIVNVFMDYARLLELVCDEWGLDAYHRAVNEVTADKLRSIAKKYQTAIGYDYDEAVAKCEAKKKRKPKDDDVGGDALELAMKRGKRSPKKKEK